MISIDRISKSYRLYETPSHRMWQAIFGNRDKAATEFRALSDVSFDVWKGETFGIVGRNGSGKSTLLQIIAGTLQPTGGRVEVNGRVAALLELGSGFNPEFTGRENAYLNATILGLKRSQIDQRIGKIIEFADIGGFIDQPVRSYSSGMVVRLAFAVVAHVDADVLIIDEALSVGDAFFSQKCMRFLRDFQKRGTLLFVSHDAAAVTNLCSKAVWLEAGAIRMVGVAQDVVEAYMAQQHAAGRREASGEDIRTLTDAGTRTAVCRDQQDFRAELLASAGTVNRLVTFEFDPEQAGMTFGAGGAVIENVELLDANGDKSMLLAGGELVTLAISVRLSKALSGLIVGFYVKDRLGQRLFGDNTFLASRGAQVSGEVGEVFRARFRFRMPVMPSGSYMIDAAVASGTQEDHTQQYWVHDALEFRALDETLRHGLIGIPMIAIDLVRDTP